MAEQTQRILLGTGRDVDVSLVAGAHEFLAQLLGGAPIKSGVACLRVVSNAAGQPFVAVIIGGKHVGFLSGADAQPLLASLAEVEQQAAIALAQATVQASPDDRPPVLMLSLADSEHLVNRQQTAPPAQTVRPQGVQSQTMQPQPPRPQPAPAQPAPPQMTPFAPAASVAPDQQRTPVRATQSPPSMPRPTAPIRRPEKPRSWWGLRTGAQKTGVVAAIVVLIAACGGAAWLSVGSAGSHEPDQTRALAGAPLITTTTRASAVTTTVVSLATTTVVSPTTTIVTPTTTTTIVASDSTTLTADVAEAVTSTSQPPTSSAPPATETAALKLEIVDLTTPVAPNSQATLTAETVPGADCTITVIYRTGKSGAQGLDPKRADGNGNVSWTWKVGGNTTPGSWKVIVSASAHGLTVQQVATLVVK